MDEAQKWQRVREGLRANADPATLEAFECWRYFERAARAHMQVEWFETFIADVRLGTPPMQAAAGACRDWDV